MTCRGCGQFILEASDEVAHEHNGWHWCTACFYSLPEIVAALCSIASFGDYELQDDK